MERAVAIGVAPGAEKLVLSNFARGPAVGRRLTSQQKSLADLRNRAMKVIND